MERRTLEEDEVVGVAVVLFKGEAGGVVVLDLADGGCELCPGVLDGGVGAELGVSASRGQRDVPFWGGAAAVSGVHAYGDSRSGVCPAWLHPSTWPCWVGEQ